MSFHRLLPLFDRAREAREPLVLAIVAKTGGSTYAKPGALMLIASDGEYAGLLSGGCLEGDLRERAREVATTGTARLVRYDLRTKDDQLFGLGAGCEGAMDILLVRISAVEQWQPLARMAQSYAHAHELVQQFVVASDHPDWPLGRHFVGGAADAPRSVELFELALRPPAHVLLLGGGPDARPVAELAAFLGWRVTVVDHRSAYLEPARFPADTALVEARAEALGEAVNLESVSAAVVMSHQLASDLAFLQRLAVSSIAYIGLLGPASRREKLLADLPAEASARLQGRLRAPVGLDIGGRSPESIALAIVGEVHAALSGRTGHPFSAER